MKAHTDRGLYIGRTREGRGEEVKPYTDRGLYRDPLGRGGEMKAHNDKALHRHGTREGRGDESTYRIEGYTETALERGGERKAHTDGGLYRGRTGEGSDCTDYTGEARGDESTILTEGHRENALGGGVERLHWGGGRGKEPTLRGLYSLWLRMASMEIDCKVQASQSEHGWPIILTEALAFWKNR